MCLTGPCLTVRKQTRVHSLHNGREKRPCTLLVHTLLGCILTEHSECVKQRAYFGGHASALAAFDSHAHVYRLHRSNVPPPCPWPPSTDYCRSSTSMAPSTTVARGGDAHATSLPHHTARMHHTDQEQHHIHWEWNGATSTDFGACGESTHSTAGAVSMLCCRSFVCCSEARCGVEAE